MTDDTTPYALVVDDDALIRMDAADIIEEAGFRPLEAYDVDSALVVLKTTADDIQLLFTDVQMPGSRDGFALARECAERWPHIKILVASGQAKPRTGRPAGGGGLHRQAFQRRGRAYAAERNLAGRPKARTT